MLKNEEILNKSHFCLDWYSFHLCIVFLFLRFCSCHIRHMKKRRRIAETFHCFTRNKILFHIRIYGLVIFLFISDLFKSQLKQQFPASLKFNSALTPETLVCPTYKRELRYIPQDSNYIIFSRVSTWDLRT
jgi:hypothetical protein